jgi:prevent-host-death family protein
MLMRCALVMARIVNLYEAKTRLSRLVDDAAAGEEIVICKSGKPKARLLPLGTERTTRAGLDCGRGRSRSRRD